MSSIGSRRWHHRERGNLLLMLARIAMRCALQVWIARSAWLHLWLPRGTSLNWMCCCQMYCLNASKALLSSMCFFILSPTSLILLIIFLYAIIISSFDRLGIGSTKMLFVSRWMATMMYLLPCWDVNGNAPTGWCGWSL